MKRRPSTLGAAIRTVPAISLPMGEYLVQAGDGVARLERQLLVKAGQAHAPGIPMKQQFAQFRFQLLDHARDHLRGNAQPRGGVAKIDGVRGDAEDA